MMLDTSNSVYNALWDYALCNTSIIKQELQESWSPCFDCGYQGNKWPIGPESLVWRSQCFLVLLLHRYMQVASYVASNSRQSFNMPRQKQGKAGRGEPPYGKGKGWGLPAAVMRLKKSCEAQ